MSNAPIEEAKPADVVPFIGLWAMLTLVFLSFLSTAMSTVVEDVAYAGHGRLSVAIAAVIAAAIAVREVAITAATTKTGSHARAAFMTGSMILAVMAAIALATGAAWAGLRLLPKAPVTNDLGMAAYAAQNAMALAAIALACCVGFYFRELRAPEGKTSKST